jgi:TctA family transporter
MFPLYLIAQFWQGINETSPLPIRILEVLVFIVLGAIGYFVLAQRMKVAEIGVLMEYLPGLKGLSRKAKKDK